MTDLNFCKFSYTLRCWIMFGLLVLSACTGDPVAVPPPGIDAGVAAEALLSEHDRDASGALSREEASGCPAVAGQFEKYDADADNELTAGEIAARLSSLSADGAGVMKVGCLVTLDGERLPGASVTLEPLPCLDNALASASGTTGDHGQCNLSVDPQDLPASLARVRGVQPGLYLVRITHPTTAIPAKYNTATTLGQEVSGEAIGPEGIHFELVTQ